MDSFNRPAKQSKRPLVLTAAAVFTSLFLFWAFFFKGDNTPVVTKVGRSTQRPLLRFFELAPIGRRCSER